MYFVVTQRHKIGEIRENVTHMSFRKKIYENQFIFIDALMVER